MSRERTSRTRARPGSSGPVSVLPDIDLDQLSQTPPTRPAARKAAATEPPLLLVDVPPPHVPASAHPASAPGSAREGAAPGGASSALSSALSSAPSIAPSSASAGAVTSAAVGAPSGGPPGGVTLSPRELAVQAMHIAAAANSPPAASGAPLPLAPPPAKAAGTAAPAAAWHSAERVTLAPHLPAPDALPAHAPAPPTPASPPPATQVAPTAAPPAAWPAAASPAIAAAAAPAAPALPAGESANPANAPLPTDRHGTRAAAALQTLEATAEHLLSQQRQRRARLIVHATAAAVGALLLWAGLAHVDEVTKGDARVISSRQLQLVQSLDGGVVSAILVREGQVVEKDQVLLKIDETRATSGARENAAQGFALRARQARLQALAQGSAFKPPPARGADEERIVFEEQRLYETRRTELSTMLSINQQQMAQRQQESSEMRARKVAAQRALELSMQELQRTRPLLASGAVSEMDILKIERDISRARGDADQADAQILRAQAAIGEAQRKQQETELTFRNEARKELADTLGKLNALNEGAVALNDKVDKSQIKSPVRGRVQRLLANTVGGVVQPGKDLVEIVPLDDKLVLEAKVQPRDIAFIHPGQQANVKFTAYDASIYGGLDAVVENISPDTVADDKGNAFYLVRVQTHKAQLGERMPIIPGMTAEVDVLTGSKSVLSYLLKPVLKVRQYALRER